MAIKLSQNLKQSQNLMMTPQLQQAIKLLTLTHLEMTNVIAEEMVENPLLEEVDFSEKNKNEDDYKIENLERVNAEAASDNFQETPIIENKDDFDWNSYVESFTTSSSSAPSVSEKVSSDDIPNYENIVSKGETLADHLIWQLRMEDLTEKEWDFAEEIIYNINDDGYLDVSFDELLEKTDLSREDGLDILGVIQKFDPVGCGSTSLSDCLLAQAWIMEERSPLLERIIKNHLEDIQNRKIDKIVKDTGATLEQVNENIALLHQSFHPKPGRLVSGQDTHYIVPDIYVHEVAGEFLVKLNDEGVPKLRVSNLYKSLLSNKSNESAESREYVQEKLRSAMWLLKSIQNRQKTIVRVANSIVSQQQDFFKKGPKFLKPMVLKNVAQEIEVHESTVSRVTTNKYMHTPLGVFELKYFFSTAIGGKHGGEDISSEALKIKIKDLVENENPAKPLSDQKISELLAREDINIARRTVAKYREMLGILSSSKRKIKG